MSRGPSSAARALLAIPVVAGVLAAGVAFAGTSVGSIHFTAGSKQLAKETGLDRDGKQRNDWRTGDTLALGPPWQPALGVELTWGRAGWPALLALDVLHSYDDGVQRFLGVNLPSAVPGGPDINIPAANVRRRARIIEIGLGLRRSVLVRGFSPYLGAGGSWIRASVAYERSDPTQGQFGTPEVTLGGHDTAIGFWAGGGIYRRIGPRFQIGVGGRYSKATVTIPENKVLGRNGGYYFRGTPVEVPAGGRHVGLVVGWSFPNRE